MQRLSTGVALGLWGVTVVASFALGRFAGTLAAAPAPEDLGAAIRAALGEGDVLERSGRMTSLLEHLDPGNLPQVLAVYDPMLPVVGESDIRPFVAAWTRFDPAGALDHTLAWPFRTRREIGVVAAIESWAQRDPSAARLAYERIVAEHRDLRPRLFEALLAGWVHSGRDGLDGYLAELPPASWEAATGIAVGALVRRGGAEAALGWADRVLRNEAYDAKLKGSTFRHATRSVARSDPERAAAWALSHAGSEYADDGPRIVAEQWGGRDGRAAIEWVRKLEAGKPREQAVREAFLQWSKSDPAGAQAWLASESLTEFHDPALNVYARRLADRAPQEAVGWCERMLDAEWRRSCLKAAATQWYRQDAVAAEAWLQASALDEGARQQVREAPAERRRARGGLRPRAGGGPG